MKIVHPKSVTEIAREWDVAAPIRYLEISQGHDKSYTDFLLPFFEDIFCRGSYLRAIDAGCGLGFVSAIAAKYCEYVIGVDISRESIRLSRLYNSDKNIEYFVSAVEKFESAVTFDCIIANMVFMDCPNLKEFIDSCYSFGSNCAEMHVVTINPNVWPRYWAYEKYNWFKYNKELFIEAPFKTSYGGHSGFLSTHIHRPLAMQINQIIESGFSIVEMKEVSGRIPKNTTLSKYPRYIYIKAKKKGHLCKNVRSS